MAKKKKPKQPKKRVGKALPIELPPFDKYAYYQEAVQSPEADVDFLAATYRELRGREALSLREDFCGTFALCCAWVGLGPQHRATGVDIDAEPIAYGKEHHLAALNPAEQGRVVVREMDVLSGKLPPADISVALNFSYFIFKQRLVLKDYLRSVYESLNSGGLAFLDCFGGAKCGEANEEETIDEDLGYSYFWDQDSFDPVTHDATFYIHFKRKGEKRREQVFSYDWRMWSIPEIRDILSEVGFQASYIYWEGNDEEGDGNGVFSRVEHGEECEAWVAYIVAAK